MPSKPLIGSDPARLVPDGSKRAGRRRQGDSVKFVFKFASREEGEAPSGKAGAVAPSEKPLQAQLGGGRLRQCLTGLDQVVALVRARNASPAGAARGPPPTRRASSGTEMT